MRARRAGWVAGVVLAAVTSGACAYKVVRDHRLDPAAIERLLSKVERIRGLKAKEPLRVAMEGRGSLRAAAEADLHRVSYLARMEDLSSAWAKVGLVPWNTDLAGAFSSVGSEAPAGYYDTADGILRILDRNAPRSEFLELAGVIRQRDVTDGEVLSHEVTHALQDMHFGLSRFLAEAPNDDAALARRCLAEGDASFVGYAYSATFSPSMESWLKFIESRVEALDVKGAPDFVNRRFQLPYLQGARFVGLLHKRGGWAAVNAAYSDPPASTEEILHPAKFLDGRDRPVDVRLPRMDAHLPAGARELWQDAVGELGLRTVLQRERPGGAARTEPTPARAAEGWDGDRAVVHAAGKGLSLAWKLAMDTEDDARELWTAYGQMMERYPGATWKAATATLRVGSAQGTGLWLERRGGGVLVLEGYAEAALEQAAAAAWAEPDGHAFDPPGSSPADAGSAPGGGPVDAGLVSSDAGAMDGGTP